MQENKSYPEMLEIAPLSAAPSATLRVPGSKSITNRALILAALAAKGYACALRGALWSEDTQVMIEALRALGFRVLTDWPESTIFVSSGAEDPAIPARAADLFVGNSGTTMRFLTALVSLGHGRYRLDGVPRMRERPIEDLLDALRQLGVNAYSEKHNGCPPVIVEAKGLSGGRVKIKGDVSSQFLSGLLLAAPGAKDDVTIEVEGRLVSWPYVYMTAEMLRHWQFRIGHPADLAAETALYLGDRREWGERIGRHGEGIAFHIPGRQHRTIENYRGTAGAAASREAADPRRHLCVLDYQVEPDASAASYFFGAAAVTGGTVGIIDLHTHSIQGDMRFVDVLADMGCDIARQAHSLAVQGGKLAGIDVDMNDISDCVMTLAAVACFADGPTIIRNVAHIRHKESDRIAALARELRKLGAQVDEFPDGLTITPRPLHGAVVETHNDHRLAMSLALVGLKVPGIVIQDPGCVAKTYPGFFEDLEKLRSGGGE